MNRQIQIRRLSGPGGGSPRLARLGFAMILALGFPRVVSADAGNSPAEKPDAPPAEATKVASASGIGEIPDTAKREPAPTPTSDAPAPPPAAASKASSALRSVLSLGGDIYFGGTNATGIRARNNDGMWAAGAGTAYPSNISINWRSGETRAARLSFGIGDLYTASGTMFRQPVEAFYQVPASGGASFTVGKYYVPFAAQEWEFEPKWGAMYQVARGPMNYAASINYNFNRETPNAYFRVGRLWGAKTNLGVSAGVGRGLLYNSSHTAALGMDLSHDFGSVLFSTEYDFAPGPNGPFQFLYGKLTYTRAGNFMPYVGAYYWHDGAQELGTYHSVVVGLGYRVSQHLGLEGAYARGNGRNIVWFQSHVTF